MIIKNGEAYIDGSFKQVNISIANGMITALDEATISKTEDEVVDVTGLYVLPGLIDIHTHGCMGQDFCNGTEEALRTMAEYELSQGITSFCPTSMTYDEETLGKLFQTAATYVKKPISQAAEVIGINMEGPYIAKEKIGAQNPKYLQLPDVEAFKRLQEKAKGLIRLVDIAPELEGATAFIKQLKDQVNISLAHTNADYATASQAFELGANHVTHLFNAMPGFAHREPGVIGAAADKDKIFVEMICDGVHLHPATVRAAYKLFGADRVVLISDSMEATGLPDGQYQLGGLPVTKTGNRAVNTGTATIAGSVTSLLDCLRWTVEVANIPLEKAIAGATINPARSIGMENNIGSLTVGKKADIIILDKALNLKYIIKNGLRGVFSE